MFAISSLVTWLGMRLLWFGLLGGWSPLTTLLPAATPTPGGTDPNATNIRTFFDRLSTDLTIFALAMAGFFFAGV